MTGARRSPLSRSPLPASAGAQPLVRELFGGRPERTLALLRAAWPHAVGPELARRTAVVGMDRRVLRVRVPDARWQKVLHRMRADILRRLRQTAGELAPAALGFLQGAVDEAAPARAASPARVAPTDVPRAIADAARIIEDPELRERFARTAARYLAQHGGRSE